MTVKNLFHHLNRRDTHLFPSLKPLSKFILILTLIVGSIFLTNKILALSDAEGSGDMSIPIETTEIIEEYTNKEKAMDDGNNLETWTNESLISHGVSLNRALAGSGVASLTTTGWIPQGLIGLTNNSIASLYQPPISGVQYIASTFNNFLGKPTYAQNGFGFESLGGIMVLWKTMRNAVYALISLFFIILGVMIMLRIKTSPQATITIQTALPKIITTLILVTFSYAIAGLIIDLSYVVEGIVLTILKNSNNFNGALNNNVNSVSGLMTLNFKGYYDIVKNNLIPNEIVTLIGGLISAITFVVLPIGPLGRTASGIFAFVLVLIIIFLYIWIQIIKLFFGLAKCFITIILQIIIGPLEISLGAFPGSKTGFSSWIINLIGNVAVFPSTIIFLVIASIIKQAIANTNTIFWSPTLFNNGSVIGGVVGIASLAILSKIPQIVPEVIFKLKPSPIGKYTDGAFTNNNIAKGLQKGIQDRVQGGADRGLGIIKAGADQTLTKIPGYIEAKAKYIEKKSNIPKPEDGEGS